MDLRALHYFVVVAEELNITRAAERLNMSQPPLSSQIKGLEEELGVQLFIRGKRHLTITDAGTHLYRRARQILELSDQTQQELMSMEGLSGDLNISLVEGRAPFLLARWIAGFRSEFPRVAIHLWNGSGDEVMERVQRGLADLALVATPYNAEQLDGFSVGREPWAAMMSKDHPLAAEEGQFLPLRRLVGQPLYIPSRRSRLDSIRAWFEELGEEPTIAGDLSNPPNRTPAGIHQLCAGLHGGGAPRHPALYHAGAGIFPAGGYQVSVRGLSYAFRMPLHTGSL